MHVRPRTATTFFVCLASGLLVTVTATAQSTPAASPNLAPPVQLTAPAAQTQPAPVPRAPVFNRANEHLPSWLRVRGEFRERIEGFENGGFVEDRNDYYALSRVRLNVAVTAKPWLNFQTNLHDARVGGKEVGPVAPPFRGPFDVRTAFADVGTAKSPVALRVGRQELAYGEQRLLGHLAWVNTGRVWDGARATLRSRPVQMDVFAASLVRFLPDAWDRSGFGNRLYGAYATTTAVIPQATFEPFVFFRRDESLASESGPRGTLQQVTVGARLAGKLPARLDYGVELAAQRGTLASDDVRAWAGHWQVRESLPGKGAVKLISEYNYASGDNDPADGVRNTFDQLYPTGHDKLGLSDQVGWKNVHHLREGVEFSPWRNTPLSFSYHTWWLADRNDGLYAATGAQIARVPGGAASSHVGQEIDVQITRALTPQLSLTGGYAFMRPGQFLEQATPGASYSAPFVMATYTFLAER
jgi:hypothetical protein